jgi:hypothetical protein
MVMKKSTIVLMAILPVTLIMKAALAFPCVKIEKDDSAGAFPDIAADLPQQLDAAISKRENNKSGDKKSEEILL